MLNVVQAGCFKGDGKRNMPGNRQVMPLRRVTDRSEDVRGEGPVHFHTIDARCCDFINRFSGYGWAADRPMQGREGRVAIENRAAGKEPRPGIRAIQDLLSLCDRRCIETSGVAHCGNPMHEKKQPEEFPLAGHIVHMHVDETGQRVGAGKGGGRLGFSAGRSISRNRRNPPVLDRESLSGSPVKSRVQHGHIGKHQPLLERNRNRRRLEYEPSPCREQPEENPCDSHNREDTPYHAVFGLDA